MIVREGIDPTRRGARFGWGTVTLTCWVAVARSSSLAVIVTVAVPGPRAVMVTALPDTLARATAAIEEEAV